jgi:putative membrane protein
VLWHVGIEHNDKQILLGLINVNVKERSYTLSRLVAADGVSKKVMRVWFQRLSLLGFFLYLAVFPGSTITVALDLVPSWGTGMGPALLIVQGVAAVAWLIGMYGKRGALAGAVVLFLGWLVEHLGETTGFPFGRYSYTDMLQPQVAGVVPVPIMLAWLMVALGAWQLAQIVRSERSSAWWIKALPVVLGGTLVLVLDLQIETVATLINPYWVWHDSGPFYGVPVVNFVAWWVVGIAMALVLTRLLPPREQQYTADPRWWVNAPVGEPNRWVRLAHWVFPLIPGLMYMLSSIMFTASNFAHGYPLAGVVGVVFLIIAGLVAGQGGTAVVAAQATGQRLYQSPADRA